MNSVNLIGRIVWDVDLKYSPSGIAFCKLRVAVDRRFKNEAGEKQSDFIDVVCFKQSAEFAANYLGKGRLVAVEGRLQSRSWVQDDGQKRYAVEVVADNVQGLDRAKQGEAEPVTAQEGDIDYDPFE